MLGRLPPWAPWPRTVRRGGGRGGGRWGALPLLLLPLLSMLLLLLLLGFGLLEHRLSRCLFENLFIQMGNGSGMSEYKCRVPIQQWTSSLYPLQNGSCSSLAVTWPTLHIDWSFAGAEGQGLCTVLKLLEVAAIVGRQSHSSFDREFLHQVHCYHQLAQTPVLWICAKGRSTSCVKTRNLPVVHLESAYPNLPILIWAWLSNHLQLLCAIVTAVTKSHSQVTSSSGGITRHLSLQSNFCRCYLM